METQTMNGHGKKKLVRKAKSTIAKAKNEVAKAKTEAVSLAKNGERAIAKSEAASFVKRNPKSAVGIALGTGLLLGAVANGKFVRATALGLAAYLGKRFF